MEINLWFLWGCTDSVLGDSILIFLKLAYSVFYSMAEGEMACEGHRLELNKAGQRPD